MSLESVLNMLENGVSGVSGVSGNENKKLPETPQGFTGVSGVSPPSTETPETPPKHHGLQANPLIQKPETPETPETPEKTKFHAQPLPQELVERPQKAARRILWDACQWYGEDAADLATFTDAELVGVVEDFLLHRHCERINHKTRT